MPRLPAPFLWAALAACTLTLGQPAAAAAAETPGASAAASAPRSRTLFNDGWRFHRGDAPDAGDRLSEDALAPWVVATRTDLIADVARRPTRPEGEPAASAVSFVQPAFDDAAWTPVTLPHDWAIAGPFSQDLPGETGKLPWQGAGWYRKSFSLDAAALAAGRRLALQLDGAMAYSSIWLNGRFVGGWVYGYTSFELDLTPFARTGNNVLAIRLHNPPDSSRWYPGSGLYRNVWLLQTDELRVRPHGVYVTMPRLTPEQGLVQVEITVEHRGAAKRPFGLATRIHLADAAGAPTGGPVASAAPVWLELDPVRNREAIRSLVLPVPQPKLWNLAMPQRYVAVTEVLTPDRAVVDRVTTPFGFRTAHFDADRGFILNGRVVPLQGVCLHHDQGALGAAFHTRAAERQLEILREMGVNAIRTAHNPPAPEFLELCDRMGFLVQVEAFDCWRRGKKWPWGTPEFTPGIKYYDYARAWDDWHERDLRQLIRRDRNHPSVVMWSIGNEVIEQWFTDGWQVAAHLAALVRSEDRTRPITGGFNNGQAGTTGFQTVLDAVGFNYRHDAYAPLRQANPLIPVYSSESASTLSSRGFYTFPLQADDKMAGRADFHVNSYDTSAMEWSNLADTEWRSLDATPGTAGEFVWTGIDYLGEPTPYNSDSTNLLNYSDPAARAKAEQELARLGRIQVPSRSSYFGIIDLAGFPKDRFYLYQARWRPEHRMAHILPHWDWPERVGQVTPVQVYSAADEAELFLNGKSLGRKTRGPGEYRFRWDDVVYAPGELKVVTKKQGQPWAEATRRTTGAAAKLALTADRTTLRADGRDLAYLTVRVTDAAGLTSPRAGHRVRFTVSGAAAELVATDNGDPTDLEAFPNAERRAFHGLALGIVRTRAGAAGSVTVRVAAEGLAPAEVTLTTAP